MSTESPINLNVSYRGATHALALLPTETLAVLHARLEALTAVPPEHQKLLYKGKKSAHGDDTTLDDAGMKDGMKITLLGPTQDELGGLRKVEDEHAKRELIMVQRRARGTVKVRSTGPSPATVPTQYRFHRIEPLPHLPNPGPALTLLTRLASDPAIAHIMRANKLAVGLLTELAPHEQPHLLGLNENGGQTLRLRVRTDAYDGVRAYLDVRRVLCHELTHNVWGEHDNNFKEMNARLNREVVAFERAAAEGARTLGPVDVYAPMGAASELEAEARTFILGGAGAEPAPVAGESAAERRRRVLDATMRRLRREEEELEQSCGTGTGTRARTEGR